MIETLQTNIELIIAVLGYMSVPAFILLVTSLIKDKVPMYTPYVAVLLGMLFGFIVGSALFGFGTLITLASIIQGALLGGTAVGIHQTTNKPKDDSEIADEIKSLLEQIG